MKESNFVSIVVYIHNDEKYINDFLSIVYEQINRNFDLYEFIFINDYSLDNSIKMIKDFFSGKDACSISIVNLCYYHGIQSAMKSGVDLSIGDYVYEFDNVYSMYKPEIVMEVYRECQNGYDIVAASENKKMNFSRRVFYNTFNKYSTLPGKIEPEFFRIYSRRTLNRINDSNEFIIYRRAVYASVGLKKKNIYFNETKKIKNEKIKYSKKSNRITVFNALLLFTSFPRVICNKLMVLFGGLSLIFGILSVVSFFLWKNIFLYFLISFYGTLICFIISLLMSFVLVYLQIVSTYTISNVSYNFESIEKISK